MPDDQRDPASNDLVISYLSLRKAIGFIGLLLPVVLAVVKIVLVLVQVCCDQPGLETSISAYYYTRLGNVFVGSLCAIGIFLMSYRGFDRRDEIAGKIAGVLAICVALFPTNSQDKLVKTSVVHLISASLLFLTLAYFSIVLFREMDPSKPPTPQKLTRNKIYLLCGCLILLGIAGSGVSFMFRKLGYEGFFQTYKPVFWFESLAIISFGFSWLTKGEAILKDD
ncbi:MAG TPA: hypothetical protein VE961_14620 [Pyrinomonadaceae bacterium]|nr:hypothetical protein [Pyrinomonadaceae bacterium]